MSEEIWIHLKRGTLTTFARLQVVETEDDEGNRKSKLADLEVLGSREAAVYALDTITALWPQAKENQK